MPRSRSRSLESIARSADPLVVAEGAGLLQQAVDQRGLAVVDVGDDGDVAKVHGCFFWSCNGWSAISPENRDP